MAINKNFVVKNGLEVNTELILADATINKVGIGTSLPYYELHVNGGIGCSDLYVTGVTTSTSYYGEGSELTFSSPISVPGINVTGVSTLATVTATDLTAERFNVSGIATIVNAEITSLTGTAGTITDFDSTNGLITNLTGVAGTITDFDSTNGFITNLTGTIGTITDFDSTNGLITNLTGTAATITTLNIVNGSITNLTGAGATFGDVLIAPNSSGIITAVSGTVTYYGDGSNLTGLPVEGIGLNTVGGPVGTGATILDFRGSAITSVSLSSGIGTISVSAGGLGPTDRLIIGDLEVQNTAVVTGILTATSFNGSLTGNVTGDLTGNATTATTATTAANVTVADESSDTSCNVLFVTAATGNLPPKSGTNLTFNSSTGQLTATSFSGNGSSLTNVNAQTLDSIDSSQFLRSDTSDTFTGTLTVSGQIDVSTTSILSTGDITMGDNDKLRLGAGDDLQIYHDGSNSFIDDVGTGDLRIRANNLSLRNTSDVAYLYGNSGGSVLLYHNGSPKLETTSTGINVTGDVNSTSDINLKKDIEVVTSATEMLNQLRGVKFTWKQNDERSVGVIAQEVEVILPELVKGEEGDKSVNYSGLVGVLIEAVKELSARVDELEKR